MPDMNIMGVQPAPTHQRFRLRHVARSQWSLGVVAEDSPGGVAACSLGEAAVVTRMGQKLGAWVWQQKTAWVG